jgi:hypothetical protein
MMLQTSAELVETIRRDGFVVVKDFFDPAQVELARNELTAIFDGDLAERQARQVGFGYNEGDLVKAHLATTIHIIMGLPGKSRTLDLLFEKIFTDPVSSQLVHAITGPNIKLRDVNCRRMTGEPTFGDAYNMPHEWHRDSPGELCIGIFMTPVGPGDNSATALVPGSHLYPYNPRWELLFGKPFYTSKPTDAALRCGREAIVRKIHFNERLAKKTVAQASGAFGKPGDFYIFLNDTWHGVWPTAPGDRTMIVLAGGFPTEFPFPSKVTPPPEDVLATLPPTYAKWLRADAPPNATKDSLIHWMLGGRKKPVPLDAFWLAHAERSLLRLAANTLDDYDSRKPPQGTRLQRARTLTSSLLRTLQHS